MNSIPIPIPKSVAEQTHIVDHIELLLTESGLLQDIYRSKIGALDELKKSLLHRAFSGNL